MPHAQRRMASAPPSSSIDAQEIEKFSRLAQEWWRPNGRLAPLHRLNPVRLGFIRKEALAHFGRAERDISPFRGLSLLDVGCGGGLITEPMARMGFAVTGADPSATNVQAAQLHARQQGLTIRYRCQTAEALAEEGDTFDVVLCMEVLEHVADLDGFLQACAALVRPEGLMIVATINKTLKSLALGKIGAEYILSWIPRGTHDWSKFVTPSRLKACLVRDGLRVAVARGITFEPLAWDWRLSDDVDVNYMVVAAKPGAK
jgi:2-polyprenyl-6-hydroxyphenyl methylase / 3-demethylubiquinone-9 3-methyltransferase